MKVLITGATGLIGTAITNHCNAQNIPVHYLTTRKEKIKLDSHYKGFYWNPKKAEIDTRCLAGVTHIINLAGASIANRWTTAYKKTILNSRIDSLNTLYQALANTENEVEQLVSASAIGGYPSSLTQLYEEDFSPLADDFLGKVVKQWEKEADKFAKLSIPVAKIRIGLVLADEGGALEQMKKPIENYVGAPLGSGKQWQSWIHLNDLAALFMFVASHQLTGVYNGVAPNPVTNKELTKKVAEKLEKPVFLPPVPGFVLKLILGEMAQLVLDSQLVSSTKIEKAGFQHQFSQLDLALENII